MNKNKKILFLSLFFVFSSVWAQEDVFRHPLGTLNMNAFTTTAERIAEHPIVKGNFVQEKYLSRFDRSLISSGNFIIAAEQGMVWETLQPFPSTMILGKDFIVQSRPDGQKSVLSAEGNDTFKQMADVLSAVFSGQSQRLLENFDVYFLNSASGWSIGLLPRDSVIASFAMNIIMSGDSAIRSIRILEQNGDIITYTMTNHIYLMELNQHENAFFTIP